MKGAKVNNSVESEIRELEERVKQADIVADPELLNKLLVDDFTFTGQDGTIYGKEQVLAAHRPAGVRKFQRYETSDLRIRSYENAAVVTLRTDLRANGTELALEFTRFWLRLNGAWRIIGGSAVELEHRHA